jgi:hypothetical protein
MAEKYIVRLNTEERQQLEEIIRKGTSQAYRIRHANILLKADVERDNWPDDQIAEAYGCHRGTVGNVRKRFVLEGLESALKRKPQDTLSRQRIFDGRTEAQLIALSLSSPPEGHNGWTLRLLADKLIELEIVDEVSHETIRSTLKKTKSSLT